jgi:ABC-type nitrate/sulfonate/bicarbonate transport system permease component
MFTSSPSKVWAAGVRYFESGLVWNDLRVSGIEFFAGYLLALLVGVPLGLLMGWYWRVHAIFDPFVSFFYSTPRIAFLPILIIWLGIGMGSKIAVIFMMAVIPFIVNTMTGVRTIDNNLIKVARAFNASDLQIFRTIILPGAIPSIISGLRLGIGMALIGIVVGEMYAANSGIGYRLMEAGTMFKTDLLFVCVLIIAGIGITASELLVRLERVFDKWRPDRS